MIARLKLLFSLMLIGSLGLLNGCGGASSTASGDVSGRASQSPIINGTIFADRVVGGASNFAWDAGELITNTDTNGLYHLGTPSYDYILVSKGGADKVTGLKQILMLAPKGSANITPLTTLVTFDKTGVVAQKVQALQGGLPFDTDVYTNSSPAVLMLVKSVELSVQALTDSLLQKSGSTLSDSQIYSIQARILQNIAATIASPSTPALVAAANNLAMPANLNTILIAAFEAAIPVVTGENGNITINASEITAIATVAANGAVDSAAQALNRPNGHTENVNALSTAAGTAESTLVSYATAFKTAQSSATAALVAPAFSIVATATPLNFSPATIVVVSSAASAIITGTVGTSGSF